MKVLSVEKGEGHYKTVKVDDGRTYIFNTKTFEWTDFAAMTTVTGKHESDLNYAHRTYKVVQAITPTALTQEEEDAVLIVLGQTNSLTLKKEIAETYGINIEDWDLSSAILNALRKLENKTDYDAALKRRGVPTLKLFGYNVTHKLGKITIGCKEFIYLDLEDAFELARQLIDKDIHFEMPIGGEKLMYQGGLIYLAGDEDEAYTYREFIDTCEDIFLKARVEGGL